VPAGRAGNSRSPGRPTRQDKDKYRHPVQDVVHVPPRGEGRRAHPVAEARLRRQPGLAHMRGHRRLETGIADHDLPDALQHDPGGRRLHGDAEAVDDDLGLHRAVEVELASDRAGCRQERLSVRR
jgi:hypothetical protein